MTSVKKEELFTMAAALNIVRDAVKQIVKNIDDQTGDIIVFNSLSNAIKNKIDSKKGE